MYLDKLKALGTILKTIERVAVIGDQRWLAAYTAIFDPITKADLRYFTTEEKETAAAWIREYTRTLPNGSGARRPPYARAQVVLRKYG